MLDTRAEFVDIRDIPTAIAMLQQLGETERPVLSAILDTSINRVAGRDFLIAFRNGAREIRVDLEAERPDELKSFDAVGATVEEFLGHRLAPRHPGIAVFAASEPDVFIAVPLPRRPTQEVVWDTLPRLTALIEILDDFERVAVALIDKRSARLFTVYLGAIETIIDLESLVVGKHAAGDWPHRTRSTRVREGRHTPGMGGTIAWSGMGQGRQRRRHDEQAMRHVREVAARLMSLYRASAFDRLILGGPEEATVMLRDVLPRPLARRYGATLALPVDASDAEVLGETLRAAELLEREDELADVRRLTEASGAGRAAVGLTAVLAAIEVGRVDRLLAGEALPRSFSVCDECGHLTTEVVTCPVCGASMREAEDPRERLITEALDQRATIDLVTGEAERELALLGGVGAFTRY